MARVAIGDLQKWALRPADALTEGWHPPVDPRLEDQYIPQLVAQIPTARPMKIPGPPDGDGIEYSLVTQPTLVEEVLGPRGQVSSQPRSDGQAKAHLGPVYQCGRHMTIEHLA
jgi:hypothetical protein